jgi:transposase
LGIEEPWKVSEVELDVKRERIDVQVVHDEGVRCPCPECGELITVYDHAPERVWRHLDTCQFKTYLHARIPRVNCPDMAWIREHVPGAEDKLIFDRYHLMGHLVQAVDKVRKQEHRELKREGLGVLAGTEYLWLYSQGNLPPEKRSLFSWLKKKRLKMGYKREL